MRRTLALAILLAAPSARAAFDSSSVGTTSGIFLQMPAGARAAAMGEAQAAAVDDATAVSWNPAALTRVAHRSVTLMHAAYVADTSYDYAAYAQNLGRLGAVGGALRYFTAGRISETDATGTEVGSFSPRDVALAGAYARPLLWGVSGGVAVKYIDSRILNTARTASADFGLLAASTPVRGLSLGLCVSDLGGTLRYEQQAENLTTTIRFGTAWTRAGWTLAGDAVLPRNNAPYGAFGLERTAALWGDWHGALRAGFNTRSLGDISGFVGPAFGLGFGKGGVRFDYAFVPLGGLGSSHRVSLNFAF